MQNSNEFIIEVAHILIYEDIEQDFVFLSYDIDDVKKHPASVNPKRSWITNMPVSHIKALFPSQVIFSIEKLKQQESKDATQ